MASYYIGSGQTKKLFKRRPMKKLLFATLVLTGSVVAANAQEVSKDSAAVSSSTTTTTTTASGSTVAADQDASAQIKSDELPEAVKKALEGDEYKGWIINAASYDKKDEKYVVELKNGADSKKVKFNKEGKVLND
jgi:hypothetical protein